MTNRNGTRLSYEGHTYTVRNSVNNVNLRCIERKTQCKGTAVSNHIFSRCTPMQPHNHPPNEDNIKILKLIETLKEKVKTDLMTPIPSIYKTFLLNLPADNQNIILRFPEFKYFIFHNFIEKSYCKISQLISSFL